VRATRRDEALLSRPGIAQMMHRVNGGLEPGQGQHQRHRDDRYAPDAPRPNRQDGSEHIPRRGWPGCVTLSPGRIQLVNHADKNAPDVSI
jgi:hypothetical protein